LWAEHFNWLKNVYPFIMKPRAGEAEQYGKELNKFKQPKGAKPSGGNPPTPPWQPLAVRPVQLPFPSQPLSRTDPGDGRPPKELDVALESPSAHSTNIGVRQTTETDLVPSTVRPTRIVPVPKEETGPAETKTGTRNPRSIVEDFEQVWDDL